MAYRPIFSKEKQTKTGVIELSTIATTTDSSLAKIVAKSGKSMAEVQAAYNLALTQLPPTIKEHDKSKYALKIVNRDLAVNTRSNATSFEGIIVGVGETRDMMTGIRQKAIEAYQRDQAGSIARGEIRVEGDKIVVLDNRKEINGTPNKRFGEPQAEHVYTKDVIIAVRKPGETIFTAGRMQLRGDQCSVSTPLGKLVKFKSLGDLVDGEYKLRSSVQTQFEIAQEVTEEQLKDHIYTAFKSHYKKLGECMAYHKSLVGTPGFWDRYVVTEGTIAYIKFPDSPDKNILVVLQDDSLEGSDGVTVWIPNRLRGMINFGRDSIVTVIGATSIGKGWDREKRVQTDEERLMLNGFSIFGVPGLTTIVEEQGSELL